MNKFNAKYYLPLVQALADGKTVQYRAHPQEPWADMEEPNFLRKPGCYRIKPEPLVMWVLHDGCGRMRGTFDSEPEAAKYATKYGAGWDGLRIIKLVETED